MAKTKSIRDEFVLDCSLALAWYFKDEADPYADAVLSKMTNSDVYVPSLWHLEIANAVLMGERRGRSTEAQATKWLGFLPSLPIKVDDETMRQAWSNTLTIARKFTLTAYDAAYLDLAARRKLAIATLDTQLRQAAISAGIKEYQP